MFGGLNVNDNVAASAHVNHLVIDGERMPRGVKPFVVAFAVELLRVEILHIGVKRGEAPGNVLVVPGDNQRQARQRDAGGVKPGSAQIGNVPGVGLAQRQVHIVRE